MRYAEKMSQNVLITLSDTYVAPRFDLTTEVFMTSLEEDGSTGNSKTIVLAHESADDLCQFILNEEVNTVICGAIEEEFFDYLTWKKVCVLDSVIGAWERALEYLISGRLQAGMILLDKKERVNHV